MRELRGGLVYFVLVFGAGFLLGTARVILLVPTVGVRTAELLEMPIMLLVIVIAARLVNRSFLGGLSCTRRLGAGFIALSLLVAAELLLAVGLTGASVGSYVASRDPVSGSVYVLMLALFAFMPAIVDGTRHEMTR